MKEAKVFDPGFQVRGLSGPKATHERAREQVKCANSIKRHAIDNTKWMEERLCEMEDDVVEVRRPTGHIVAIGFRAGETKEKVRATMM